MAAFTEQELLAREPFLSLRGRDIALLMQRCLEKHMQKNQTLVMQDDWGESVFLLRSGMAKVRSYDEDGHEMIFSILSCGDVFGEMSLLDGQKRSADVVAMTPVTLIKFTADVFKRVMETNSLFALALTQIQVCRLRELNQRFMLQRADATTRLLAAMAYLCRKHSGSRPTSVAWELPEINQQEIGNLAGLTEETTCRIVRRLRARGVIGGRQRSLRILDPEILRHQGLCQSIVNAQQL